MISFHVERRTEQRRDHRCGANFQARFRLPSFYSCLLLHSIALYMHPHLPKLANRLLIATSTRQTPEPTQREAADWQYSSGRSARSGLKTPADGRSCGSFWASFSVSSRCSSCSTKTRKTSKPSRGGARTTRLRSGQGIQRKTNLPEVTVPLTLERTTRAHAETRRNVFLRALRGSA